MFAFIKETFAKAPEGRTARGLRALLVALLIGIAAAVVAYKLMRTRTGNAVDGPKKATSSLPRQTRQGQGKEGVGGVTETAARLAVERPAPRSGPPAHEQLRLAAAITTRALGRLS